MKCSDSVRLVSGPSLCSGSVQIWDQSWTWVCEGALDQQGAEVLCRELGCGAPSLLQGALSPLKQKFQCEGHESALMDCPRSGSETCSSGAAVNLTCSEPLRLVGGASRCAGTVEVRHRGEWRRVVSYGPWSLEDIAAVCRDLDCGSAVFGKMRKDFPQSPVWRVNSDCVKKKKTSAVKECVVGSSSSSSSGLDFNCSDPPSPPPSSPSVWMLWLVRPLLVSSPYAVCTVLLVLIYRGQRRTGSAHVVSMETGQQEEEYDDIAAEEEEYDDIAAEEEEYDDIAAEEEEYDDIAAEVTTEHSF
ncbi:antigen WC1.1-like [Periophthalmus magnuspinnatus]|uniref:antigen WC1.1-like n=1 Tax=Periophthalmus magnuspinnatus TaxID=409849 RepID=UPI0024368FA2|nr:antigen WC1.1-like [Periophthalmus magnuspinnatus]